MRIDADPGDWTAEQFIEMDARFVAAMELAFRLGRERRASAGAEIAGVSEGPLVWACYRATRWRRSASGVPLGGMSSMAFV